MCQSVTHLTGLVFGEWTLLCIALDQAVEKYTAFYLRVIRTRQYTNCIYTENTSIFCNIH